MKLKEYVNKRQDYIDANNDNSDKYRSKFWKIVKNREEQEQLEKEAKDKEISDLVKRKLDYGKNAMELYKPKISKKKRLEMTLIKQNMESPNNLTKMRHQIKSTQHKQNKSMTMDSGVGSDTLTSITKKYGKPKPPDESRYTYTMFSPDKHKFVKHDYLTKDRIKKQEANRDEEGTQGHANVEQWMSEILKAKMNDGERIDYIKIKSSKLETEMARKEKMMKIKGETSMGEAKELNGYLIDSIKTKLSLINNLKDE